MSIYGVLRFLHISAAILFVGGLFARQAVRSLMAREANIAAFIAISEAAGKVERLMVIPGNILAMALGLVLALTIKAPILGSIQGVSSNWLLASIIILALLLPLVPIVFLPRGKLFEAALVDAKAKGVVTPELRLQLNDPTVRWAHRAELIGTALIVALMVLKPF